MDLNIEYIILRPIKNEDDVETLRKIRNTCKDFMTRNTTSITSEQQKTWYLNIDKNKNNLYLVERVSFGVTVDTVGYGYVRVEDGTALLTGGLIEEVRGQGYGSRLFELLLQESKKFKLPIKLEVLKSNMKAFAVYNKLGFRVISDDGKILKMEYYYDSVI
jgi:ribosomal protein S18 acetylase RimI-like enzyme